MPRGAQILQENLEALGLRVEITQLPRPCYFSKIATPGEAASTSAGWAGSTLAPTREMILDLHVRRYARSAGPRTSETCRTSTRRVQPTLLDEASRLTGARARSAYGELDVELSRDAAPAIPLRTLNAFAFVSARVGCVVMNPDLDLTAVCLK